MDPLGLISTTASTSASAAPPLQNTAAKKTANTSTTSSSSNKDTVTLSDTAKELSKILGQTRGEASSDDSSSTDPVERIKKKMKELEDKIAKVNQSSLPENAKEGVVKGLQSQLADLQKQLAQLMTPTSTSASTGGKSAGSGKA